MLEITFERAKLASKNEVISQQLAQTQPKVKISNLTNKLISFSKFIRMNKLKFYNSTKIYVLGQATEKSLSH